MIDYLLDTDISSYFLKGKPPHLRERIITAMQQGEVAISVITRAELRYGLEFLPREHRLHELVHEFFKHLPVFPWDEKAADHYARLSAAQKKQGQPIGILDIQIAAHVLAENLTLITNNERDFVRVPELKIQNWAQ